MTKSIVGEIGEQLKELGKETVRATGESGKEIFKEMLNLGPDAHMDPIELARKKQEKSEDERKLLAQQRKMLAELEKQQPKRELSVYDQKMRDEELKNQQQVQLAQREAKRGLPQTGARPTQGNRSILKRRKKTRVEIGKVPGQ